MPDARPPAQLLRTFVRPDERQTLFILMGTEGDIQIVEDAELWEEPIQGGDDACYQYYPTMFTMRRFTDLNSALEHTRKYCPWIDGVAGASNDCAAINETTELVGMREG